MGRRQMNSRHDPDHYRDLQQDLRDAELLTDSWMFEPAMIEAMNASRWDAQQRANEAYKRANRVQPSGPHTLFITVNDPDREPSNWHQQNEEERIAEGVIGGGELEECE